MKTFIVKTHQEAEGIEIKADSFEVADVNGAILIFTANEAFVAAFAEWTSVQEKA